MYAVVNHLSFAEPVTDEMLDAFREVIPRMREAGSLGVHIVEVDDRHLVLVIFSESREVSDRVTETIGSPFMREHVVHLLDGPTQRSVGDVVVSSGGVV